MKKAFRISKSRKKTVIVIVVMLSLVILVGSSLAVPRAFSQAAAAAGGATLLDGYRHVEVASVSAAMERITGQRIYLSHRMRPIFPSRFA